MNFQVTYTSRFQKEAKRLAKKYPSFAADMLKLIDSLKSDPQQGHDLGKNLYKVRLAIESKSKVKSGGARVITYVLFTHNTVYLTAVYDKSDFESVSIKVLLKLLKEEGIIQ